MEKKNFDWKMTFHANCFPFNVITMIKAFDIDDSKSSG